MANFSSSKWRGAVLIDGEETNRAFIALEGAVKGHALMKAAEAGADILEPAMRAEAPRGEGDLAASITSLSRIARATRGEADVGPITMPHAAHVELGHRTKGGKHVPANPFMRRALANTRARIVAAIGNELKARIARLTGG